MPIAHVLLVTGIASVVSLPWWPEWTGWDGWHRSLHRVGATVFLATILGMALWVLRSWRSGERTALERVVRWIPRTDVWLVLFGVDLLTINGAILAPPYLPGWSWLVPGAACFVASGVIWGLVLMPLQRRLVETCASGADPDPLLRRWFRWGAVALVLPLVSLTLMLTRPG